MIRQTEYSLRTENGTRLTAAAGSVLHGALMEKLPAEAATAWHQNTVRPYSQGLYYDRRRERTIWRINTLTAEAAAVLDEALQAAGPQIFLKQKNLTVELADKAVRETTFEQLTEDAFTMEQPRGGELHFLTATGFKQAGRYVLWPETSLIWQSLLIRWNAFAEEKIDSPDLHRELAELSELSKYQLRSQAYSVDGNTIFGFAGSMRLRFSGSDMARRILTLLTTFAPFAGVGIKTALGMGITDTILRTRDKQKHETGEIQI